MHHHRMARHASDSAAAFFRARAVALAASLVAGGMISCGAPVAGVTPFGGDLRPPGIVDAGPSAPTEFTLLFDEDILPVGGSYLVEPGGLTADAVESGSALRINLPIEQEPGMPYRIAGEAKDRAGNVTRFLFSFTGWNGRPPELRINEVQTGKNSSTTSPHRDYIELEVISGGNIGGVLVEYASTVKDVVYAFPPAEVRSGDLVVLHCAPEGIPAEKNETETDTALSGGVDAHPSGRDFWCPGGGLPDASGLLLLRAAAGAVAMDGMFYAEAGKGGTVDADRITLRLAAMAERSLWRISANPVWEDAFQWKPSSSRPLHRKRTAGITGAEAWVTGESGTQSPGRAAPADPPTRSGKRSRSAGGLDARPNP